VPPSSAEPHADLIKHDPGKLRIALSHHWGNYSATPHIVDQLQRADKSWKGPRPDADGFEQPEVRLHVYVNGPEFTFCL
jgi:hypothetical protein